MALFIRQDDERSELQRRVAAELREKAKKRSELDEKLHDGVEDSSYLQDTKQTTSLAWIWILIVLLVIAASVVFIVISTNH